MIFGCLVAWIGDEKSGFLFSFSSSSSAGVWLVLVEPCPKHLLAASESKVVWFESHFFVARKKQNRSFPKKNLLSRDNLFGLLGKFFNQMEYNTE